MELVMYIESAFGIELDDTDLERENLATIGAITSLVTAKKGLVAESGDV
jgi:acyl carrier protein